MGQEVALVDFQGTVAFSGGLRILAGDLKPIDRITRK